MAADSTNATNKIMFVLISASASGFLNIAANAFLTTLASYRHVKIPTPHMIDPATIACTAPIPAVNNISKATTRP